LPSVVLMENAGHGIAQHLRSIHSNGKVIICCGKGNNGGDGYVVARYLNIYGIEVQVLVFAEANDIKGDAKIHLDVLKHSGLQIEYLKLSNLEHRPLLSNLNKAEWIIDGLFGTGLTTNVGPLYFDLINTINKTKAKILSIDVPSGLDCNTGRPLGTAIIATITCTLISMKSGFLDKSAQKYLGILEIINLGISNSILQQAIIKKTGDSQ
jgi:NAD(P)H-hydrate epimerase